MVVGSDEWDEVLISVGRCGSISGSQPNNRPICRKWGESGARSSFFALCSVLRVFRLLLIEGGVPPISFLPRARRTSSHSRNTTDSDTPQTTPQTEMADEEAPQIDPSQYSIMVVDDDNTSRTIALRALKMCGYPEASACLLSPPPLVHSLPGTHAPSR